MNLTHRHTLGVTLALLLAVTASAQTALAPSPAAPAPVEEKVQLAAFTVTGTNIKRLDQEKVLPITVFDAAAIEVRDASQASDLLTALPQVTGLPGNETATLGATARGDNSSVSLRGIPSGNTLVLLNGRRLTPHPISQAETGTPALSVNVNQLPNRGLERIDVLRDGASSIYGTDAVAGVINYITDKNFIGTEIQTRYGETRYGDGREYRATLTHGLNFANGKGRAVLTADYYDRGAIFVRGRAFASEADNSGRAPAPWNVSTSTVFNFRSATTEYGNFLVGTPGAVDRFGRVTTFAGARPAGVPTTLTSATGVFVLTPLAGGGVGFATAAPARASSGPGRDFYWNNNTYRVIQPKSARTNAFASLEYDLNDRLAFFADASLYRAHSVTFREPDGITQTTDGFVIVPATNPWNPFGTRFWSPTGAANTDGSARLTGTPSAVSITNKRLTDIATRTDWVDNAVYRGLVGLRGRLGGSWTWEGAMLWSAARVIENEEGPSRKSLLINALNQTDPARAFNPFTRTFAVQNGTLAVTGDYRNPESVQRTFRSSFIRSGITKLGSGDLRASGDVLSIWGGNSIGAAVGGEFRYEAYDDYRPPFAGLNPDNSGLNPESNDFLGFSPNSDTHGNRHVAAAYAEAVLPLVGNKFKLPLVQSLELSASVRYESYTDFGDTTKPKYGLTWRPIPWAVVRASYNEGFRAPNLAQLFTGDFIRTVTNLADNFRSPVTGLITDGPANRRTLGQGNRALTPESSKGRSAGLVLEPPMLKGLSFGIDYWEIDQKDVINAPTSAEVLAGDNRALQAATQAALARGTAIGLIDLGSGTAGYLGDSSIVRLAVTQADRDAFAAYNATRPASAQRATVGSVSFLRSTFFNKASQFVNGFDFDVNYRFPRLAIGQFNFNTNWTRLVDFHANNAAGSPRTELRGTNAAAVGGASPPWRGSVLLNWNRQSWSAGLGAYYTGSYTDVTASTTQAIYDSLGAPSYLVPVFSNGALSYRFKVGDTVSYNVNLTYRIKSKNRWFGGTSVRVGVINLLDAEPPLAADSRGYDAGVYNSLARGRTYSLQLTKKL